MLIKSMKKIMALAALAFLGVSGAIALPGISHYLPDVSGEYVYYRDYTFSREAVVGFVYYSETIYGARFYSPAKVSEGLFEKDISIYVTIDPAQSSLVLTGEKIVGASVSDDSEIINYLHDLLYEFTARRQKVVVEGKMPVTVNEEFMQFGGNVKSTYSISVPLFNLVEISDHSGKKLFTVETTGLLASSADTSFSDFKGVDGLPKDRKRDFKKISAQKIPVEFEGQSIVLDSMWKQSMDNFWLLGDSAILTFSRIPNMKDGTDEAKFIATLVRKILQGTAHSYSVWPYKLITENQDGVTVMNVYYQPETENVTRDFKIITKCGDGFAFMTLTVFDGVYQKNRSYFDSILKTYSVK